MSERINDPGFGARYNRKTKRIINKDGSFNVRREGIDTGLRSMYEELTGMSLLSFSGIIALAYFSLNVFFATIYFFIGVENLSGAVIRGGMSDWLTCFYFSFQTFTTVGYGALSPIGHATNVIASIEALLGLMGFALATGLVYGRFSKPKAKLIYSEKAVISPFQDKEALMFRLANRRGNVLMDMEARMILMIKDDPMSAQQRSYYRLNLQVDKIHFLPMSWTVVHPIDEESPLFQHDRQYLVEKEAEILILVTGFDDTFNQIVHSRHSYTCDEIVANAKFTIPYEIAEDGDVVMNINDIHNIEKL